MGCYFNVRKAGTQLPKGAVKFTCCRRESVALLQYPRPRFVYKSKPIFITVR